MKKIVNTFAVEPAEVSRVEPHPDVARAFDEVSSNVIEYLVDVSRRNDVAVTITITPVGPPTSEDG